MQTYDRKHPTEIYVIKWIHAFRTFSAQCMDELMLKLSKCDDVYNDETQQDLICLCFYLILETKGLFPTPVMEIWQLHTEILYLNSRFHSFWKKTHIVWHIRGLRFLHLNLLVSCIILQRITPPCKNWLCRIINKIFTRFVCRCNKHPWRA